MLIGLVALAVFEGFVALVDPAVPYMDTLHYLDVLYLTHSFGAWLVNSYSYGSQSGLIDAVFLFFNVQVLHLNELAFCIAIGPVMFAMYFLLTRLVRARVVELGLWGFLVVDALLAMTLFNPAGWEIQTTSLGLAEYLFTTGYIAQFVWLTRITRARRGKWELCGFLLLNAIIIDVVGMGAVYAFYGAEVGICVVALMWMGADRSRLVRLVGVLTVEIAVYAAILHWLLTVPATPLHLGPQQVPRILIALASAFSIGLNSGPGWNLSLGVVEVLVWCAGVWICTRRRQYLGLIILGLGLYAIGYAFEVSAARAVVTASRYYVALDFMVCADIIACASVSGQAWRAMRRGQLLGIVGVTSIFAAALFVITSYALTTQQQFIEAPYRAAYFHTAATYVCSGAVTKNLKHAEYLLEAASVGETKEAVDIMQIHHLGPFAPGGVCT